MSHRGGGAIVARQIKAREGVEPAINVRVPFLADVAKYVNAREGIETPVMRTVLMKTNHSESFDNYTLNSSVLNHIFWTRHCYFCKRLKVTNKRQTYHIEDVPDMKITITICQYCKGKITRKRKEEERKLQHEPH